MFYVRVLWERKGLIPTDWDGTEENATSTSNDISNTSMTLYEKMVKEAETSDQVEILWSITVAIFVLFGMMGSFMSGKLAERLGR